MLICRGCGSLLISIHGFWCCPYRKNRLIHERGGATEFRDLRVNTVKQYGAEEEW